MKLKKIRLDKLILEQNLIEEKLILPMVMAGEIFINDEKATSIAQLVDVNSNLEIRSFKKKYVSRGGFKLEKALEDFKIEVKDLVCADFGASTGGFTDVLLKNGAKKVYSIETAKGELDMSLRNDTRVINLEDNSLFSLENLPLKDNKIDFAVCDLSFVTLKRALPKIFQLTKNAPMIALLKPHYEAQDESLLRNGIVKDDETRMKIVEEFKTWCVENNIKIKNFIESPIKGGSGNGNIEYLVQLQST